MDIKLKYGLFRKKIDIATGSILYYRKDLKGLPDKVYEGDGYTVEVKNDEVYLIDIFNSEKLLHNLLKTVKKKAA